MKRNLLPTIGEGQFKNLLDMLERDTDDIIFFVEVGAYDGISGDPIYHKAVQYNWSGILIEPVTSSFRKLKENYAANPNVIFENIAIDQEAGIRAMYLSERQSNLYLSAAALRRNVNHENNPFKEELVRCMTLQSVLNKHKVQKIDLLQVDAEGNDLMIIKNFDFERYQPAVVNFEANILHEEAAVEDTIDYLMSLGYKIYNHRWHQAEYDVTATTLDFVI